jgi:hypothetical protein
VRAQGASEDKKFAAKPTKPDSNFSNTFGINSNYFELMDSLSIILDLLLFLSEYSSLTALSI